MDHDKNRAAIFAALAQGLDLAQILKRFKLSDEELRQLFQEAADYYRDQDQGFWRLYCDGASRGNPGPAGAGAALYDPQGKVQAQRGWFLGEATNNVAEYQALLLGLKLAEKLGVTRIQVFADSQLLVHQLNGHYRVKAAHLLPLWREAKQRLQNFEAWAISHTRRELNLQADALANQAIDQKLQAR